MRHLPSWVVFCVLAACAAPPGDHAESGKVEQEEGSSESERQKAREWEREMRKDLEALGIKSPNVLILTREGLKKRLENQIQIQMTGRVRINDPKRGILVDVGEVNHGIRDGDIFEVLRGDRIVGRIEVISPDRYHSYAEPIGDTTSDDIKMGDRIRLIREY